MWSCNCRCNVIKKFTHSASRIKYCYLVYYTNDGDIKIPRWSLWCGNNAKPFDYVVVVKSLLKKFLLRDNVIMSQNRGQNVNASWINNAWSFNLNDLWSSNLSIDWWQEVRNDNKAQLKLMWWLQTQICLAAEVDFQF